mgnify:CR=1 FL=1
MKPVHSVSAAVALLIAFGIPAYAEMPTSIGDGEGEVDIVAWPGYIERGETDKNYDWVTDFEKETGCKVNVKTAATSDEMVTLMNQGGFDLVTASGDASLRLVAGKKVQPVNVDLIPSWKSVDERLQNAPWHTVDGVHYGVPYQWGPNVLAYNSDVFKDAPKSWSVVFEEQTLPDGKSNKGRVQAYDGPIYIADAALYLSKTKPELKIQRYKHRHPNGCGHTEKEARGSEQDDFVSQHLEGNKRLGRYEKVPQENWQQHAAQAEQREDRSRGPTEMRLRRQGESEPHPPQPILLVVIPLAQEREDVFAAALEILQNGGHARGGPGRAA